MGHTPKTRFVISVDDIPRELLSIEERKNGDLLMFFRPAFNHEGRDGNVQVLEERLSVHRSANSEKSGTTMTHHYKLAGGRYVQNAAFVLNSQTELRWMPKFSWSVDLNNDRFVANLRTQDRVVNCGSFEPSLQSLFLGVLIERAGGSAPTDHHISCASATFDYFTVTLYFVFVLAPSIGAGRDLWLMTKLPRIDGETHPATEDAQGATALTADQVLPLFKWGLKTCQRYYLGHLEKVEGMSRSARDFITTGAHLVCPAPVVDWQDLKKRIASSPDDFPLPNNLPDSMLFNVTF